VDAARVAEAARALRDGAVPMLLLGGRALRAEGLRAAARIASATGARVVCETFPARLERGAGLPAVERLPYFPEQAVEFLAGVAPLVLAGARDPVAFFAYRNGVSRLAPANAPIVSIAGTDGDPAGALADLADALDAPRDAEGGRAPARPELPEGPLTPAHLGAALAALQPEGAIVVDEAATSGLPYFVAAGSAAPHTYLTLTGGAIGQGMPCAVGAAIACPDRRVIALQADGSGMYTLQSLWTEAREGLDVLTVICANRSYRILQIELARAGIAEPGPAAVALTTLSRPVLDWVALARGMGVPGVRVERAEDLTRALREGLSEPGPRLIEAVL
jgi:acetolactate synthase-1/2/3 large subunit